MFQKSLLKNFVKSFSKIPDYSKIYEFIKRDFIAEDANGAEFIALLGEFLHWNYKREVKNSTDQKKADGVIFDNKNNPVAIIELKSSNRDISNRDIIAQAFRYKNEKPTCRYVFISNFKQIDIYIDSSDKCFSIDLTKQENFPTLYAILNQETLQTHQLAKLKENSKTQEEITKEVYKKYSEFRLSLIQNLIKNNPNLSKEEILSAVNKLLDRFMFILFAEDRGLIPANTIFTIIKHYEEAHNWGDERPLYDYYKKYFQFIDKGNEKLNIPKYNGNLFKPDELLDNLIIDDEVIKDDLATLSAYDFSEDVDVEVLGHIFEQSLSDLEAIKEELIEGHKTTDKRKKEGVFYTPKFVTEFIIKNTIGKLCENKKNELHLKNPTIKTLHEYKKFLENLKIVDPACGSGAFLNEAFRYLLKEHEFIKNELLKSGANLFEFMDVDKEIIEKNLFGVDINEASVGITKLSLWLQTAKRDRALSDLSGNIKCENSLTADWNELFPEIMQNGGFDVVIGNPPYVRQERIKELKPELKKIYKVFSGTADLFVYFYELSYNILKENGFNGFICSNKFFRAKYGKNLRELILTKTSIKAIVDFSGVKVFEDASVDSAITILEKGYKKDNIFQVCLKDFSNCFEMNQDDLSVDSFVFVTPKELEIKKKIEKLGTPLKNWDVKINYGIKTGLNEAFIIDEEKKEELIKKDSKSAEIIKPLLRGRDIKKYECEFKDLYVIVAKYKSNEYLQEKYPVIYEHLLQYKEKLQKRGQCTNRDGKGQHHWLELDNNPTDEYLSGFEKEKIFYNEIGNGIDFCFDDKKFYCNNKLYFITSSNLNLKYSTAIFNSNLYQFYFKLIFNFGGGKGKESFKNIPIPQLPKDLTKYIKNIDYLLNMPKKEKYDKIKKYAIAEFEGKEIYTTEFLVAKNRGWIDDFVGHKEIIKEYLKIVPYIFSYNLFDEVLENIKDGRKIYVMRMEKYRFFHILDEKNYLISFFVMGELNFNKQLNRRFRYLNKPKWEGGHFSILSPARPFWRHLDLFNEVYQKITKNSITQRDFIEPVDTILDSKDKIKKYKKHLDKLSPTEKIEVLDEIEKLEKKVNEAISKIDEMVYKLYNLTSEEVEIVETT